MYVLLIKICLKEFTPCAVSDLYYPQLHKYNLFLSHLQVYQVYETREYTSAYYIFIIILVYNFIHQTFSE